MSGFIFYLGSHRASWLTRTSVPLFLSRRVLPTARLKPSLGPWALDSGGFTELSMYGEWRTSEDEYVGDVLRYRDGIGNLNWVAPQDWMCEPFVLAKTKKTLSEHQQLTVSNFVRLRERLGLLVIPVLQGWKQDDYARCWELYERCGVDLEAEPLVGIGSVCRRQDTAEAGKIIRSLAPLRLHGFGIKLTGIESFSDALVSADSLAWSLDARWRANRGFPSCAPEVRRSCANCLHYALTWLQESVQPLLQQERLWEEECLA